MDNPTPIPATNALWARLTTMSPKYRERWAQVRMGSKRRFVWRDGIFRWGGLMFLMMCAVPAARDYVNRHTLDDGFWSPLISGAVVWPVAGYFFGRSVWALTERQFVGPQASPPPPPSNQPIQRTAKGDSIFSEFDY